MYSKNHPSSSSCTCRWRVDVAPDGVSCCHGTRNSIHKGSREVTDLYREVSTTSILDDPRPREEATQGRSYLYIRPIRGNNQINDVDAEAVLTRRKHNQPPQLPRTKKQTCSPQSRC